MSTDSLWRSYGKSAVNFTKAEYFLKRAARVETARFYTSFSYQMDLSHTKDYNPEEVKSTDSGYSHKDAWIFRECGWCKNNE